MWAGVTAEPHKAVGQDEDAALQGGVAFLRDVRGQALSGGSRALPGLPNRP